MLEIQQGILVSWKGTILHEKYMIAWDPAPPTQSATAWQASAKSRKPEDPEYSDRKARRDWAWSTMTYHTKPYHIVSKFE